MAAEAKLLLQPVKVYANFAVVLLCPIPALYIYVTCDMSSSDEDLDLLFLFQFLSSIVHTRLEGSTKKKDNNNEK